MNKHENMASQMREQNSIRSKIDIKRYSKLATVTEAPANTVLERIEKNPEMMELFLKDLKKVIESLQHLDKWKKSLYYGKQVKGLKTKKNFIERVFGKIKGLFVRKKVTPKLDESIIRILHGSVGIATESGELLEAISNHLVNNKEFDVVNVKEELADVGWYQNVLFDVLKTTVEESFELWHKKLKKRYGDKFTEFNAINRDLDSERKLLEEETKE